MEFKSPTAEIFVPDDLSVDRAMTRTTHLGIGAHQDDLEIMAIDGILACFQQPDKWFSGVIVTDGGGSPRADLYRDYTDDQMRVVRAKEQKLAAMVGDFSAVVLLGYPSSSVKNSANKDTVEDIQAILKLAQPEIVYTHNLADKHPTHIAVAVRVIQAIRELPADMRPQHLYGCEVWRDLGWTLDEDKIVFDCTARDNLQTALVGVFDSQICGGKRYDLATMGRRRANATYFESHGVDTASGLAFGMDLTPLIIDPSLEIAHYVQGFIDRFSNDVHRLLAEVR